jgi:two-component system C4-dicarboxylate transport sensor histidine kinase DctB
VDADRAVASRTGRQPRPEPRRAGRHAAACLCLLGIILNERRRHLRDRLAAREALQQAHDELERKVEERTADLSAANRQLQDEVGERIRAERTLRAAQDELVQAGKLAVIGQLSTGIAHELNQPLAALRTLSANAERFLERGDVDTTRTNLGRIADLVDRMGRITGQLRNFARKSSGQSAPVALASRRQCPGPARCPPAPGQCRGGACPVDEPVALCDANRLEQVLINLIGNASTPWPASPGRIDLAWECADGRVRLRVRDHGPGLSAEAQAHLFEPFFTTKPAGDGLGLG